jgi:hypothetical protein
MGRQILYAILAIQHEHRQLKDCFRHAWDSVFTWHRMEGTQSRLPVRTEVVQALCHFSLVAALSLELSQAAQWLGFGVCLRTAFHALLQPRSRGVP